MLTFPNAKINLGLYITEKRADGFHNLETCFYPVSWTDGLEILSSDKLTFTQSGILIPGSPDQNLCLKAYQLLAKDFDLPPVKIHLHKVIPTGAGLGGGSADGAFTLKILNEIFELTISEEKLEEYAAQLGSDCPFFICNTPVFATGRGEIFENIKVELKGKYYVVVHPGIHISTSEAFSNITPKPAPQDLREVLLKPVAEWKELVKNDFEESVFPAHPELKDLKEKLYELGAEYAAMSGSGSAIFGLFSRQIKATEQLPEKYLVWEGFL
jgi:4-diphosphocytidyl-2-C-methyl-D-erythritol kinase